MASVRPWQVAGTYLESCNCAPICPCRTIGGVPGGRSTYGVCLGVLSWHIDAGQAGGVDLGGLNAALAVRYSDDEPGSPWDHVLYVDERGSEEQRAALTEIFTGRLGGSVRDHFPWAWKPSRLLAVRPCRIELDHASERSWLRVDSRVRLRISHRFDGQPSVTCVIPGHHQAGEEVVAEELVVSEDAFAFELEANCGYRSVFEYSG